MKYVYNIIISMFFILVYSCATNITSNAMKDQKAESEIYSDDQNLRKGRMLAKTECTECHRFYSPEEYTSTEWERIIKRKSQRLSLRIDQITALDFYFQSESSTGK